MQVHFGVSTLRAEWRHAIVCVGTFDGVHLGHQAVIRSAVELAREELSPCVLVTFDRHPAAVLAPDRCPKAIASLQDNLAALEALGVSAAIILEFDAALSRMSAQRFLDEILIDSAKARKIVVGHDFAMGNNREGNTGWLKEHIETVVVSPFELEGERVSSSEIRSAIASGQIALANRLLGRPFAIPGIVVEGEKLGRQLGYPTANIARSFDQVMPLDGVYAGWFTCRQGKFRAATSIGTRPAIGGTFRTIEPYLLDYPGESLYGESVRLELCQRIREELNFGSIDALVAQIAADVQTTRVLLPS
jgi:riboflavin kinase/FMN adenylyltransferase